MTQAKSAGERGPAEHERRQQIVTAASEHFKHYGYTKTTVGDLAKAIGLSTAYIYKFFDSKRAIGESVCRLCLGEITTAAQDLVNQPKPASERLRLIFIMLAQRGAQQFFNERKMHDIVAAALEEHWQTVDAHHEALVSIVRRLVQEGRQAGEFERKTPIEETCRAILLAMEPVKHPVLLEQRLDTLEADAAALANLVLRSLAP
jgi:AcrR family transcriptional regulator